MASTATAPFANFGAVSVGLTVEPGSSGMKAQAGAGQSAPNVGVYDFGAANPLDKPTVLAHFTLRNTSAETIELTRLQPSCHCTTAIVGTGASQAAAGTGTVATLAPGAATTVQMRVDLNGQSPGPLHKFILVYTKGQAHPAAVLQITGTVQPEITITPSVLDLGDMPVGHATPLRMKVTFDKRLASQVGPLTASMPYVQITPAVGQSTNADTARTITRVYQVTVSPNAPIGPLNGTVQFAVSSAAPTVLHTTQALIIGHIRGAVSAEPEVLAFGTVTQGTFVNRPITLTGKTDSDLRDAKATTSAPWLTATWMPADDANMVTRTLKVTVTTQAPAGVFQTPLVITLADGHTLQILVTGYIMPVPAASPNQRTEWQK